MVFLGFYREEVKDLVLSWILLSALFVVVFSGIAGLLSPIILGTSLLLTGIAFVLHELGHKFLAQRYGCRAIYVADYQMLGLSLVMAFFGILFAAPGAVRIAGRVNVRQFGLIALAGPVVNMFFAYLTLGLFYTTGLQLFFLAAYLNGFLAAFNLIPFGPLDGAKIISWSWKVWLVAVIVAGLPLIALA